MGSHLTSFLFSVSNWLGKFSLKIQAALAGTKNFYSADGLYLEINSTSPLCVTVGKVWKWRQRLKKKLHAAPAGPLGGIDLERGYGNVRPWRPPFHASPVGHKGPISSTSVSSQDPLLRKFGNFNLYSLNFCPNFSCQAPKFGNFQLTSPQIWKFSVHKPPLSEASISLQASCFGIPGSTPLPQKKLSPPGLSPGSNQGPLKC